LNHYDDRTLAHFLNTPEFLDRRQHIEGEMRTLLMIVPGDMPNTRADARTFP
jgi:hypothetical protein